MVVILACLEVSVPLTTALPSPRALRELFENWEHTRPDLALHPEHSHSRGSPAHGETLKSTPCTPPLWVRACSNTFLGVGGAFIFQPSNSRPAHGSADLDPFKFRWLIPISALQVRLGNTAGTENNSIWELIHTKSEIEGRPETIFQLCCRYY